MPKSIEILRGRFLMPRAGFNQHKLMPGPSCFGLHISSRNKSAEAPRAVQGLLGLEVAGTGWGWLWEPPELSVQGQGLLSAHPQFCAQELVPALQCCSSMVWLCLSQQPKHTDNADGFSGNKSLPAPWAGKSLERPPGANQRGGKHRGRAGASSCTAQHAPGIPWQ